MKTTAESGCASAARWFREPSRPRWATVTAVAFAAGLVAMASGAAAGDAGPKCRSYELVRLIPTPDCGSWIETVAFEGANSNGEFVGSVACSLTPRAFRGHVSGEIELLEIPGQIRSSLSAIRDDGLAVGAVTFDNLAYRGLLSWPDGTVELVDPPGDDYALSFEGVNDAGLIVGWVQPELGNSARRPMLYDLRTATFELPDIGDADQGQFSGVDGGGAAYGWVSRWIPGSGNDTAAMRFTRGTLELLPEPPGIPNLAVTEVTDQGRMLVPAGGGAGPGTLFATNFDTQPIRLSALRPDTEINGYGIDDGGWVIGGGDDVDGMQSALLWRPDGAVFPIRASETPGAEDVGRFTRDGEIFPGGDVLITALLDPATRVTAHLRLVSQRMDQAADFDCDKVVGFSDLLYLLDQSFGPCGPYACYADLDGDGAVGFADLVELIAHWD